jgi:hypothetical protein
VADDLPVLGTPSPGTARAAQEGAAGSPGDADLETAPELTHAIDCDLGEDCTCGAEERPVLTLAEQLDQIPQHVTIWPDVDLGTDDPAHDHELGRRRCIAARRAGGRCTVRPVHSGLLCGSHAGILDPSAGGHALAAIRREANGTAEERRRVAALGVRGAIVERLNARAKDVQRTVDVLLDAATQGDLQAAKLVIPYINQGMGMPREQLEVHSTPGTLDLESMSTFELQQLVAQRRLKPAS